MLEQYRTKKSPKIADKFSCNSCLYHCSKESDWNKHLNTRKHKNRTKLNNIEHDGEKIADYGVNLSSKPKNGEKIATSLFVCECGKKYSARNSLWYHKKTCYIYQDGKLKNNNDIQQEYSDDEDSNYSQILPTYTKEKEVEFKELILLLLKENKEIQKNFVELIPYMKGNAENSYNTTHTNSHNTNNFNIQMFLNEHCKNAMNLTDFIHSLPITSETYDNTIENGLTKTITNMITNGLNNMDVLERPIHCTDPSRKTMYVKDNNVWEKDNELKLIVQGIKTLSFKQRTNISKWKDANNGWDIDDNLQTKMTKLVFNSMTSIEDDEKETNKIIRAIGKNTYLSNEIKDEYK